MLLPLRPLVVAVPAVRLVGVGKLAWPRRGEVAAFRGPAATPEADSPPRSVAPTQPAPAVPATGGADEL